MLLNFAMGEAPVPISYTNEIKFVKYSRVIGYEAVTNSMHGTNMVFSCMQLEYTNYPAAIIHCVAYGRGTNECFKLYTCEALPVLKDGWNNADWCYYNSCTWISKP